MKRYANPEIASAMHSIQEAIPRARADPTRPVYHFCPPAQWMNDPNGTIYHNGYYHIFYQHNPYDEQCDHIHWGHARSKDLVHWEHLPIALWPSREIGEEHCYSGCTVINDKGQPMIFYTSIGPEKRPQDSAEQWAALGDDNLITWKKHIANPILTSKVHGRVKIYQWRDPFIFREQGRVFMVLGGKLDQMEGGRAVITLYEAEDEELTCWRYRGILFRHPNKKLRSLECPNFFRLGDKWVLVVSPYGPVEYFIGTFDLKMLTFKSESRGIVDHSTNFYATNILFDRIGRCVLFGWVRGFKKNRGWNGCLSLPRILSIGSDGQLVQKPAPELQKLRDTHYSASCISLTDTSYVFRDVRGDTLEILAEFEPGSAKTFDLRVRFREANSGVMIAYNGNFLDVAGTSIPFHLLNGERIIKLHVFMDRSAMEVYINDREWVTCVVDSCVGEPGIELFVGRGSIRIKKIDIWEVKSIWI